MYDIYIRDQWQYTPIDIGMQGENLARRVLINITPFIQEYGKGKFVFVVERPTEDLPYIALNTEQNEEYAIWNITEVDTAIEGEGKLELRYYVDNVRAFTIVWKTKINKSLYETGDIPTPIEEYINKLYKIAEDAENSAEKSRQSANDARRSELASKASAEDSEDSATASSESARQANADATLLRNCSATATSLDYGTPASASYANGVFSFGIPKGKDGDAATTFGNLVLNEITASSATYPELAVNDIGSVVFGKIKKYLDDLKNNFSNFIATSKIADNLTSTDATEVLSAPQGKALSDKFSDYVPTANIADNLTTDDASKVLSAKQGKVLKDSLTNKIKIHTTNATSDANGIINVSSSLLPSGVDTSQILQITTTTGSGGFFLVPGRAWTYLLIRNSLVIIANMTIELKITYYET